MRDWLRNTTSSGFERFVGHFVAATDRDLREMIDLVRAMRGAGRV
jgi:hypothetical protein